MLKIAKSKRKNLDIKYIEASFSNFKIPTKVDTALCLDFSTNYILSNKDFVRFLKRVYNFLKPGGIFIFDFKPTEAYLKKELHLKKRKFSFDCVFDIKNKPFVNADMRVTIKKGKENLSFIENHLERGYNLKEMKNIVNKTNFDIIGFFDNCRFHDPSKNCELIQVALRKNFNHSS
jgi:ubiquinone/menaquinone biosynthesis C-methylase UbiE